MKYTPGPWSACDNGKCKCKQVWSDNHPIAEVTHGKWGDDYPAMRIVGPSINQHVETYMEQITYGEVFEEFAEGNARLIAEAPEMYEALKDLFAWARKIDLNPIRNEPNYIRVARILGRLE